MLVFIGLMVFAVPIANAQVINIYNWADYLDNG